MEKPKENMVKVINSTRITEVMATCAFGFALISFLSTAIGLNQFAFEDSAWRGFLLSFCIQSILLTLNLNMPKFLGSVTKGWKITVVVFYATLLSTSSFFSFVFITNLAYEKTYYVDTQAIIEKVVVPEISDSKKVVKHEFDIKSREIYDAIEKLENDKIVPTLPQLNFIYTIKDVLPLGSTEVPDDTSDRVFVSEESSWVLKQIQFCHDDLVATRRDLKNIISGIDSLDKMLQPLSRKNINVNIVTLRNARDLVEQYITQIEHYRDIINSINKKIDDNLNLINQIDMKSDLQKGEYDGATKFRAGLENQYYERQRADIIEVMVLIRKDTATNGAGYLQLLHKDLTNIINSDNVPALFIEATGALRDGDKTRQKTTRDKLYSAVEFVSKNQTSMTDKWTYQDFDVNYLSFETLFQIDSALNTLHDEINQLGLVTEVAEYDILQYAKESDNYKELNENERIRIAKLLSINDITDTKIDDYAKKSGGYKTLTEKEKVEIAQLLLATKGTTWKDGWNSGIVSFHKILLQISSLSSSAINDFDLGEGRKYNSSLSNEKLIDLLRVNLTDMSAVERAMSKFTSDYPHKAIFSLVFALFMDMASLIVGMMVYLRTDAYQNKKNSKSKLPRSKVRGSSPGDIK